ncbi:keratinocyte differentiation factor 1 [Protopterus annectens]|uniref:keratinocyte differentiation factor 1 n=1 Tax=Protopterus annectens TaxID=7888 RepID=UPI001CFBC5D5|nr:keratinocyte differentiation factor 1 [Protopterus annectens]XP_043927019.1 keratinocyte differentiation factor 1 [Protopterus annectens]
MPGNTRDAYWKQQTKDQRTQQILGVGVLRTSPSKDSDLSLEVQGDQTPNLRDEVKQVRRGVSKWQTPKQEPAYRSDPNGMESEKIDFIPKSAEGLQDQSGCGPVAQFWNQFRNVLCCVLTCGKYKPEADIGVPCVCSSETSTDPPDSDHPILVRQDRSTLDTEINSGKIKKPVNGNSFNYPDVRLHGKPVSVNTSPSQQSNITNRGTFQDAILRDSLEKPPKSNSPPSSVDFSYPDQESDNKLSGSMSSAEIDNLIMKKLLELFSNHQIDELAKCTSDTVFLQKTSMISELISSITHDYSLDEEDAECRLVQGVIRISTRKPKSKNPKSKSDSAYTSVSPAQKGSDQASSPNLPDSGNETMKDSFISSQGLDVQISDETTSDVKARNMRPYTTPPGSPFGNDSLQNTETESSSTPLIKVYC